jgi:hypothetical protein
MVEKLDGSVIEDAERFKHWKCANGHIMGVTERVRVTLRVKDTQLKYYSVQLSLFRDAVDPLAEKRAEIDVTTVLNGRILSMVHRCSVCGDLREWHPEKDVMQFVTSTYLAE